MRDAVELSVASRLGNQVVETTDRSLDITAAPVEKKVRNVIYSAGRGLSLKQIRARLPEVSKHEIEKALIALKAEGAVIRAGGVGAGYRYWPGN